MRRSPVDSTHRSLAVFLKVATHPENFLLLNQQLDYGGHDLSRESGAQHVLFILDLLKEESS